MFAQGTVDQALPDTAFDVVATRQRDSSEGSTQVTLQLAHAATAHDWSAIHAEVRSADGVIVDGLLDTSVVDELNAAVDRSLAEHTDAGRAETGSELSDRFLGARTIRLHGLLDKIPSTEGLLAHPELVAWAEASTSARAASVLLSAGELIEIRSGEPAQLPHRDSDSWPAMPIGDTPVVVNAIVALDEVTLHNGATYAWRRDDRLLRERRPWRVPHVVTAHCALARNCRQNVRIAHGIPGISVERAGS